jgi:hypothetical protein
MVEQREVLVPGLFVELVGEVNGKYSKKINFEKVPGASISIDLFELSTVKFEIIRVIYKHP